MEPLIPNIDPSPPPYIPPSEYDWEEEEEYE